MVLLIWLHEGVGEEERRITEVSHQGHSGDLGGERMKDYERIRADVSKHFKNEIENLKLEIIKLQNENNGLQIENFTLKRDIQEYKNQLESMSDSQKSLFGLTTAINQINNLI